MSISLRPSRSTRPVAYRVGWKRLAASQEVSSTPNFATGPTRLGSSTSGVPCSITAAMTVHQHTPNSSASSATGRAFSPTWRHASIPARRVNRQRAENCAEVSVQVLASQSGSTHRQRRLRHTSRAGRPKQARSRTSTAIRSCASALVPHAAHPATVTVVSIVTTSSSDVSATSRTRKPSNPNSASARPLPSLTVRGLPSSQPQNSRNDGQAPGLKGGCRLHHPPHSDA